MLNERASTADERDALADERDRLADQREHVADQRDDGSAPTAAPETRNPSADELSGTDSPNEEPGSSNEQPGRTGSPGLGGVEEPPGSARPEAQDWAADRREFAADDRQERADERQVLADARDTVADQQDAALLRAAAPSDAPVAAADAAVASAAAEQRDRAAAARDAAGLARRIADRDRANAGSAHPLAAEFVTMARTLLNAETVELAMTDVVEAAVRFVNGCDAASYSAYVDDVATTIASTSAVANGLDNAQYLTAQGPCLLAIQTLQLVISDDLSLDDRWPELAATAGASVSAMSLPVADDDATRSPFGSLNNYGMEANAFDGEDADTAILLTAHLGVLLRVATAARAANERVASSGKPSRLAT